MKKFTISLISLCMYLSLSSSFAQMQDTNIDFAGNSIEWQKIKLQDALTNKVKNSLRPILQDSNYITEVDIVLDDTKDFSFAEKIKKKKKILPKSRFSEDSSESKTQDDYVVMAKIGLDAPSFGAEDGESETSDVDLMQKTIIELSDKYNLFNYVKEINILVYFNEDLTDASKKSVKKVVESINFNLGKIKPKVEARFVIMSGEVIQKSKAETAQDKLNEYLKFAEKFSGPVGLIIAVIIFGLMAYLIYRKYERFQREKMILDEASESKSSNNSPDGGGSGGGVNSSIGAGASAGLGSGNSGATEAIAQLLNSESGIERFKKYIVHSPMEAALLLKKWLREQNEFTVLSLKAIVQLFNNDELMKLFSLISLEDRNNWKKVLGNKLGDEEIKTASDFIAAQIIDGIIVPSMIEDVEVAELLLTLTPEQGAEFVKNTPEVGVVIMNVMSSRFLASLMGLLEGNLVTELIQKSVQFKKEEINEILPTLKSKLMNYKRNTDRSPFMDKILDLIPIAAPENENALFAALAAGKDLELLKSTARNFVPSVIIDNFKGDILQASLKALPLQARTEFLLSLEQSKREAYLETFSQKGSKARDMMDIEIEKLSSDASATEKIGKRTAIIKKEYITLVRRLVARDNSIKVQVYAEVDTWCLKMFKDVNEPIEQVSQLSRAA